MIKNCTVDLGDRSYSIHIGAGILDTLGEACRKAGLSGRCLVVTDEQVAPLYAEKTMQTLTAAGFSPRLETVPSGETSKSHTQLVNLYSKASVHGLDRKSFMVALGGGVVGDLTGFAAASWLRGIRLVQVPTTLLAMVDSSVGGKTGINIAEGKNLVGAFHQPELVLADLSTLQTLSPREFSAGAAEVIKYGIIRDADLFDYLEKTEFASPPELCDFDVLGAIVSRCCEIKADVVREDERESGLRKILNFGHTLAHAIEQAAGYGQYLHGEAVAIGMVYAAELSAALKDLPSEDAKRIKNLIQKFSLPVSAPELKWDDLRAAMSVDKKTVGGIPEFVLADRIGHAVFGCSVPETLLKEVRDGIGQ